MKEDMTYNEIDMVKANINLFVKTLLNFAERQNVSLSQSDINFFVVISKHIIFYKYMYQNNEIGRFYKVLVSDCYYLIISVIRKEHRYMYVNERSIIENYLRLIINKTVEEDHITEKIFKEVKKQYSTILPDSEFSLLRTEYLTACGYIHGGNVIDGDLSWTFNECIQSDGTFKDINKYYIRVQRILKILDRMIMYIYKNEVSGAFHRRKSLLEYLIGKDCVNILFI